MWPWTLRRGSWFWPLTSLTSPRTPRCCWQWWRKITESLRSTPQVSWSHQLQNLSPSQPNFTHITSRFCPRKLNEKSKISTFHLKIFDHFSKKSVLSTLNFILHVRILTLETQNNDIFTQILSANLIIWTIYQNLNSVILKCWCFFLEFQYFL